MLHLSFTLKHLILNLHLKMFKAPVYLPLFQIMMSEAKKQ